MRVLHLVGKPGDIERPAWVDYSYPAADSVVDDSACFEGPWIVDACYDLDWYSCLGEHQDLGFDFDLNGYQSDATEQCGLPVRL